MTDGESRRFARMSFARFTRYVPALLADRADALKKIAIDLGDVVEVPVPGKRLHLVTHPEYVRHVLQRNNKNYRRSFDFRTLRTFLGEGLLTTHDEAWRYARRVVTPSFGRDFVTTLIDRVVDEVERFERDRLNERETILLATATTSALSLEIFAGAMLGVDVRPQEKEILRTVAVALRHLDRRLVAMFDVDAYFPTISGVRFQRAVRAFDRVLDEWTSARRECASGERNLFDVLIEASEALEPDRRRIWLRDQIATYLAAGHETIAVAVAWCLLLLAEHEDVQARVREECRGVLGTGRPTREKLAQLPYTESVLLETMRLFPPVWSIGREAIGDDRLGDAAIPAGATVMVSPYAIHRRPDLWQSADAFCPQRFEHGPPKVPFAYIPFGAGARSCIGEHLSMLELRVTIASLARSFEIRRADQATIKKEALISLRPKPDFSLSLRRLD